MAPQWKGIWQSLGKWYVYLHFDTEIPLLRIYHKDTLRKIQKDLSVRVLTAALFVIEKD